jgi:hypothetical protein
MPALPFSLMHSSRALLIKDLDIKGTSIKLVSRPTSSTCPAVKHIPQHLPPGDLLVFLPGEDEIELLYAALLRVTDSYIL